MLGLLWKFCKYFYYFICISYCNMYFYFPFPLPLLLIDLFDQRDRVFIELSYLRRENEKSLIVDHLWPSTGKFPCTHNVFIFIVIIDDRYCYCCHFTDETMKGHDILTVNRIRRRLSLCRKIAQLYNLNLSYHTMCFLYLLVQYTGGASYK